MEDSTYSNEYYELHLLLLKTRHAAFRAREVELAKHNISPEHALILISIVNFGDNATTKNISQSVFREFHTVFAQLRIMENAGLIQKIHDFPKKDRFRFVLTEKGYEAYHQSRKQESINRMMSVLSAEERKQLSFSLNKLLESALKELNLNKFEYKRKMEKRSRKPKADKE